MSNTKQRASLGFADELDAFDPSEWEEPKKRDKPPKEQRTTTDTKKVAEVSGFRSREPKQEAIKKPRRYVTGRNRQLNLKATDETIETFGKVADANGWSLAETLEEAVGLLAGKHLK